MNVKLILALLFIFHLASCSSVKKTSESSSLKKCRAVASKSGLHDQCEALFGVLTGKKKSVKPVSYPEQAPIYFKTIKHINYKGMERAGGEGSLIGRLAFVTYTEKGKTGVYKGRVIEDFEAGMSIIDERNGEIHRFHVNFGEINKVKIDPSFLGGNLIENTVDRNGGFKKELLKVIGYTTKPFGSVMIRGTHLFGALSTKILESDYKVVMLKDAQGNEHIFDPDYIESDIWLISKQRIEKEKLDEDGIFASSSSQPIKLFDKRRKERRKIVKKLISNKKYYNDPLYYKFFEKDLEYTKKYIERWYPYDAKNMVEKVSKALGEKFIVLLADPGVTNRVDQLIQFGRKHIQENPRVSPFELRAQFADTLGKKKVFQGMMLSEDEKAHIEKNGISADLNDIEGSLIHTMNAFWKHWHFPVRLDREGGKRGSWLRVSEYQDVAKSVDYHNSKKSTKEGYAFYILEMEVSEISIIREENLFIEYEDYKDDELNLDVEISIGSKFKTSIHDLRVSMLTPYGVNPEDIIEIKVHPSIPPKIKVERVEN